MMKRTYKYIILASAVLLPMTACTKFLEPLPDGTYNQNNYMDDPVNIRGFIDKAYELRPDTYYLKDYIGTDAASDDLVYRDKSNVTRKFAIGDAKMDNYPFANVWTRGYQAMYYVNLFLKDDLGKNTRYLVDKTSNEVLQRCLQGDAYGLRAWYGFNLLEFFGGKDSEGNLLGVPIFTEPVNLDEFDASEIVRPSYDDCVEQILADCDSALAYLPLANRDQFALGEPFHVTGAIRYRGLDGMSIQALKAKVLLTWASPAFNPSNDKSRWRRAAEAAKVVMDHKLNIESTFTDGFNPSESFSWTNPNSPEIIYLSTITSTEKFELNFYPLGFRGSAEISPTQNLVDAFPMANGYPISDFRSNYDPKNPYNNRDPRFYANIFYNGCEIRRDQSPYETMYVIESYSGGKDAPGLPGTSPSGYYTKKYIYLGWNPNDLNVQKGQHCIFFFRWTHMCLIFAEAANNAVGPTEKIDGLSAKEALQYIRKRPMADGTPGLGATYDPYLDECATNAGSFNELVKNEWRIETLAEGIRFHNLRRWATDVKEINMDIKGIEIKNGEYSTRVIETRSYPSLWLPIPYGDIRKSSGMKQNEGWESWK